MSYRMPCDCRTGRKAADQKQYRYAIDRESIEFVSGRVNPGEPPEEAAKREFEEEAGLMATDIERIGTMSVLNGTATQWAHIFVAKDWRPGTSALEETEYDLTSEWISLEEWKEKIKKGEVFDAESLAAWTIYQNWKSETNP
jgi:8-oxo-dGTP pyrophosphatase MutT (NUDIX family)